MKDWLERFNKGEFVIHCETEQEAKELMKILRENGYQWYGKKNMDITHFETYKNETCYNNYEDKRLLFCSITTYANRKIVKFSELNNTTYLKQIKGEWNMKLEIKNVIYNPPATIVFWNDDTKTIVKTTEGEDYSPMYGVLMAYYQKHSGMSKTQTGKFMDKVIKDAEEQIKARNKVYIVEKDAREFQVGDTVIIENTSGFAYASDKDRVNYFIGKIGEINRITNRVDGNQYIIKFENTSVQECNIKDGNWYFKKDNLRLIK